MRTGSLSRELRFLETAFEKLNDRYFKGALPTPILTIQSSQRAYGHCSTYHAWKDDGQGFFEINIGAETLNRPLVNVIATMVHEMVHLYCMVGNIQDTSRNNTYHNRRFKREAEGRDLSISYDKRYGYAMTSPGKGLVAFCEESFGADANIRLHRVGFSDFLKSKDSDDSTEDGDDGSEDDGNSTPKGHSRKYLCAGCGCSVRATREVRIMCMDCDREMLRQ